MIDKKITNFSFLDFCNYIKDIFLKKEFDIKILLEIKKTLYGITEDKKGNEIYKKVKNTRNLRLSIQLIDNVYYLLNRKKYSKNQIVTFIDSVIKTENIIQGIDNEYNNHYKVP